MANKKTKIKNNMPKEKNVTVEKRKEKKKLFTTKNVVIWVLVAALLAGTVLPAMVMFM